MFKYLIADYILGYCLSTDHPFSAKEIGEELHVPADSVSTIMAELVVLRRHWFHVHRGPVSGEFSITRKKEYDEEMITWLTRGSSRTHFKFTELTLKGDTHALVKTVKQRLRFTLAILRAIIKFCLIILIRQFKKNRQVMTRYITVLKDRVRENGKIKISQQNDAGPSLYNSKKRQQAK